MRPGRRRRCRGGNAGDRGPGLKGLGPGGSILDGRAVIAAEVEEKLWGPARVKHSCG
jgi:hypothetical protein